MPYSTRSDIEDLYGTVNVETWANIDNGDTDNAGVQTVITARIARAIEYADGQINDRLRDTRYVVPVVKVGGGVPVGIVDIAARLAGAWLYKSRGFQQVDADGRPVN